MTTSSPCLKALLLLFLLFLAMLVSPEEIRHARSEQSKRHCTLVEPENVYFGRTCRPSLCPMGRTRLFDYEWIMSGLWVVYDRRWPRGCFAGCLQQKAMESSDTWRERLQKYFACYRIQNWLGVTHDIKYYEWVVTKTQWASIGAKTWLWKTKVFFNTFMNGRGSFFYS